VSCGPGARSRSLVLRLGRCARLIGTPETQGRYACAEDLVLGRLATEVARILRGKHKPTFAPHIDTGDHVIVINAEKVVLTSNKADQKLVYRHSGYPGGLKSRTFAEALALKPEEGVRRAVRGMLPKNRLGRQMLTKLKVYAGPNHPHSAQLPESLDLAAARRTA
jgi:large subunit ribosomal protein L13